MRQDLLEKLNVKDVVGVWEAEEIDEYSNEKGYIILSKEEFIFVYAGSSEPKVREKLENISVRKVPLVGVLVSWKGEGGFLKKLLQKRSIILKVKEEKEFLTAIKEIQKSL